jgi:uncharacterized membrane protein YhaH (DUF805 family)
MAREFAQKHGSALSMVGGALATAAAVAIGAVLVVIAVMASVLLGLAGLALRAKRARARSSSVREDGVIEARHLGGHHWVAYGWNERR